MARLLATPPPVADRRLQPYRKPTLPESLIRTACAQIDTPVLIGQDFIGYANMAPWPNNDVGIGIVQVMKKAILELHDGAGPGAETLRRLHEVRWRLQMDLCDFEVECRALISAFNHAVLVPASPDGSLGNDGLLAVCPAANASQLATRLHMLAHEHAFRPVTIALKHVHPSVGRTLSQLESCLASSKAHAASLGQSPQLHMGVCGKCKTGYPGLTTGTRRIYIDKQRALFATCENLTCP